MIILDDERVTKAYCEFYNDLKILLCHQTHIQI